MQTKTEEHKKNLSIAVAKLWADPEYRAKMTKKQREVGFRTYQ